MLVDFVDNSSSNISQMHHCTIRQSFGLPLHECHAREICILQIHDNRKSMKALPGISMLSEPIMSHLLYVIRLLVYIITSL